MASLCEVTHSMTPRVDREAGVIRGVKVLGRDSKNGRTYSDKALSEAAKLYDKRDVNLNHPPRDKSGQERPVEDMFGWLESVEVKADGVYADLHYATTHPMAPAIVEIAQKNPMRLGLSHNAEGTVARRDGKNVVESIQSVKSVDLVQTPATVSGLFESTAATPSKTCRQILEDYTGETLPPVPGMDDAAEVPEAPGEDSQAEAKTALTQVFSAALMSGGDLKTLLAKVIDLATAMMGGMPEQAEEEVPEDTEEQPGDEAESEQQTPADGADSQQADPANPFAKKEKPMAEATHSKTDPALLKLLESVQSDLRDLKAEKALEKARSSAVALLEGANVEPTEARVTAVLGAADDAAKKALVESWPQRERIARGSKPAVRPLYESTSAVKYPESIESFVSAIR